MEEYFGIIEEIVVGNPGIPNDKMNETDPEFNEMKNDSVRFIHYPDCQQLVIRLPNNGWNYGTFKLYNNSDKTIVEEAPVLHKLNGNYQIVYDTISIAPGMYTIELNWKLGYCHTISFNKNEAETIPAAIEEVIKESIKPFIVDHGNARIEYDGNARAGTITYIKDDTRISFSHEIGGGNCLFFVMIPTVEQWEKYTKTPLSDRENVLQFVAETLQKEQASGARFEIDYNQVTFFRR